VFFLLRRRKHGKMQGNDDPQYLSANVEEPELVESHNPGRVR
jgi:hypothetical protein